MAQADLVLALYIRHFGNTGCPRTVSDKAAGPRGSRAAPALGQRLSGGKEAIPALGTCLSLDCVRSWVGGILHCFPGHEWA